MASPIDPYQQMFNEVEYQQMFNKVEYLENGEIESSFQQNNNACLKNIEYLLSCCWNHKQFSLCLYHLIIINR